MNQVRAGCPHHGLHALAMNPDICIVSSVERIVFIFTLLNHGAGVNVLIWPVIPSSCNGLALVPEFPAVLCGGQMPGCLLCKFSRGNPGVVQIVCIVCAIFIVWY